MDNNGHSKKFRFGSANQVSIQFKEDANLNSAAFKAKLAQTKENVKKLQEAARVDSSKLNNRIDI